MTILTTAITFISITAFFIFGGHYLQQKNELLGKGSILLGIAFLFTLFIALALNFNENNAMRSIFETASFTISILLISLTFLFMLQDISFTAIKPLIFPQKQDED